jgi:hypothetical protein
MIFLRHLSLDADIEPFRIRHNAHSLWTFRNAHANAPKSGSATRHRGYVRKLVENYDELK